jgi:CHAT domain-containing protein
VAGPLARARRVLVLRDGPLHFVPFAALPLGSGALLVEKVPVHVAPSATVFAELASRPRPGATRVAAFADPLDPPAAGAETALRPLPGTRREAAALREVYGDAVTLRLGADATEERVKALGPEVSHLHLACHGLVDPRSPLDSSLALSAPAPGAAEDGRLQAWEVIEQLRLHADLVVLSACDTALGEELPGEGVLGLAYAFQLAGARSVLSTQWTVEDASAARLVERFYRGLHGGLDAAAALRAAQLATRRRPATAHPYYWASFQLDGDWR